MKEGSKETPANPYSSLVAQIPRQKSVQQEVGTLFEKVMGTQIEGGSSAFNVVKNAANFLLCKFVVWHVFRGSVQAHKSR